jgi:hypothetical protein
MDENSVIGTIQRDGMNEELILTAVLERYKLGQVKTYLLGTLWNHVYRVESEKGQLYSLRLYPPIIQESQELEDELIWHFWIGCTTPQIRRCANKWQRGCLQHSHLSEKEFITKSSNVST